jgi:hypothetical protein
MQIDLNYNLKIPLNLFIDHSRQKIKINAKTLQIVKSSLGLQHHQKTW